MFNAEESLNHLRDLRRQVSVLKGQTVEGLSPIEKEDEVKKTTVLINKNQNEMNA